MLEKAKKDLESKGKYSRAAIVDDDLKMSADEIKMYA